MTISYMSKLLVPMNKLYLVLGMTTFFHSPKPDGIRTTNLSLDWAIISPLGTVSNENRAN